MSAPAYADRVQSLGHFVGGSPATYEIDSALDGYLSFADAMGFYGPLYAGDELDVLVEEVGGTHRWEVFRAEVVSGGDLERVAFLSSSTGSTIAWAGTETLRLSLDWSARQAAKAAEMADAFFGETPATLNSRLAGGRLSLSSSESFPSADQLAKTTLYYLPHAHDRLAVYDGSKLVSLTIPAAGASVTTSGLSADTVYDVFGYESSGALALELFAWTNTTTRAAALVRQDGVWCKTGALTRRYLGTVATDGSTQFNDTAARRCVFNADNRVPRPLLAQPTGGFHAYTSTTYREFGGGSTLGQTRVSLVCGLPTSVLVEASCYAYHSATGGYAATGVGVDVSSASSAQFRGSWADNPGTAVPCKYQGVLAPGYHTLRFLQQAWVSAGTMNWTGVYTSGGADVQAALTGSFLG